MLVLTRKLLEKLYIGDDICVTVVRLEGGQVRLGIDAPREVSVVRAELVADRAGPRLRAGEPSKPAPNRPQVRCSPSEARAGDSRRRARFR
jgi:carbon storage regulator